MRKAKSKWLDHRCALLLSLALGLPGLAVLPTAAHAQSPCGPTTTVQPGDTYFSISQRCDVSVSVIRQANPGVDHTDLQIGQTLQLQVEAAPPAPTPPEEAPGDGYRVQAGDTLQSIALTLGTTIDALLAANPDIDPSALRIGQIILPPRQPGRPIDPRPGGREVSGVLTEEGVECQAMRGHDGELYTLVGELDGYRAGDVVQVRGTVPEVSICQQGTTIEVDDIRRAR